MKITDNKKAESGTKFMTLNPGDVFEQADYPGVIMMKLFTNLIDPNETAVRLDNGYLCYISDKVQIHPLDSELVIRR